MRLEIRDEYPVVNGHRVRYVAIMRDGWYGCNDTVCDWDGWNKDADRPLILKLLDEAEKCSGTKFGQCGCSFERLNRGRKEMVVIGFYEKEASA